MHVVIEAETFRSPDERTQQFRGPDSFVKIVICERKYILHLLKNKIDAKEKSLESKQQGITNTWLLLNYTWPLSFLKQPLSWHFSRFPRKARWTIREPCFGYLCDPHSVQSLGCGFQISFGAKQWFGLQAMLKQYAIHSSSHRRYSSLELQFQSTK